MLGFKKMAVLGLTILTLFLTTPMYAGQTQERGYDFSESQGGIVAADLLVIRPVGFLSTVLGTAIFSATLPFTVWGGKEQLGFIKDELVDKPAKFTFVRPVGDIDGMDY